jgi:hypothetical protein
LVTLLAAGLALLAPQEPGDRQVQGIEIVRDKSKGPTAFLQVEMTPLERSRLSPKKFGNPPRPWEFPWLARGFVKTPGAAQYALRFRVYSQDRKEKDDRAQMVVRMMTALWEENYNRLRVDHSDNYNGRIVDVFLCWGGKAGGEQRFDVTFEGTQQKHVNTIYFYDLNSFTDPVETAREVSHEYGHASLPAIGTYEAPEDWANGYLGEKLFLRWARDAMAAGRLYSEDVMGATQSQLDAWIAKNVDPLVVKASQALPTPALLASRTAAGMDAYIGLALYASAILPEPVFARSLLLTGSTDAKDYPEAVALAAEEPDEFTIPVPAILKGRPLWIPLNKGKIAGGKILRSVGKWTKIQPTADQVVVTNRRS